MVTFYIVVSALAEKCKESSPMYVYIWPPLSLTGHLGRVSLVLGMSLFVFVCVFVCLSPSHDIYLEASFWLWDHMISFQVSHWATLPHCLRKGGRDRQIAFVKPNKTANKQRRHVFMESTYWVADPLGFTASLTGLPSLATQTETYSLAKNRKLSGILRCEQRRQRTGDELKSWVK